MNLIDLTYLANDCQIAASQTTYALASVARYQKELLLSSLGYELWKLIDEYSTESEQRIKDIVDGAEYTQNIDGIDRLMKWNGLKNSDKVTPITYYVLSCFLLNNWTVNSGVGQNQQKAENGEVIDLTARVVTMWNKCRELMGYIGQDASIPSLYNYLQSRIDDYPELHFSELQMMNSLFI